VSTKAIGQGGQWERAERSQSDDRQADAQLRAGESGLIGQRGAVCHVTERSRDVAQRGHDTELTEP
jgi:hypothetical protein